MSDGGEKQQIGIESIHVLKNNTTNQRIKILSPLKRIPPLTCLTFSQLQTYSFSVLIYLFHMLDILYDIFLIIKE